MMNPAGETSVDARRRHLTAVIAEGNDAHALSAFLRDADWRVREEAVRGIRSFRAKEALTAILIEALSDTQDIAYRNAAAMGLAVIGSHGVVPMQEAAKYMDADARKLVAEACANIPTGAAVTLLIDLSHDADPNVRAAAFEALGFARTAGPGAVKRASEVLTRGALENDLPLRMAALSALATLGEPLHPAALEALATDDISLAHAARAASGTHDPEALARLARFACRRDEVGDAALCALATSLEVSRGGVFLAVSRAGDALRGALELAASSENEHVRSAALDLLPAVFRPEHVSLYLKELSDGVAFDAAARGLAALAPMLGEHLLTSAEYSEMEALPVAARILAPLLDEPSALAVSRRMLLGPPPQLAEGWLDVLLRLQALAEDVSWQRVYEATLGPSAGAAMELLARRATAAPRWARDELVRLGGGHRDRASVALLCGIARAEPLSSDETRSVEVGVGAEDPLVREVSLMAAAQGVTVDVRTMIAALADETPQVVVAAVEAAARSGCIDEIDDLARRTTDARVLVASVKALSSVANARAVELVELRMREGDERLAAAALSCVPATCPAVIELCERATGHAPRDGQLSLAILRLLEASHDPRALAVRTRLLEHPRFDVRALAASSLSGYDAREVLTSRLEREEDATVAEAIRKSLRESP
ncbi:MAG: HEAT repeat domain-containing protein [Polyangiaceae bacterium]